jgi:hypothetical protein
VGELPTDALLIVLRRLIAARRAHVNDMVAALVTPRPTPSLPVLTSVYWRRGVDERTVRRSGRLWTLTTLVHTVPFVMAAIMLAASAPVTAPVGLILVAHAWIIPELRAARGAGVVRLLGREDTPHRRALGLLGELVDGETRALQARTSLVLEACRLGVWLVGEPGGS